METKVNKEEQNELKQNRERGASLVEYGLLVALIVGGAVFAINALSGSVTGAFLNASQQIDDAVNN